MNRFFGGWAGGWIRHFNEWLLPSWPARLPHWLARRRLGLVAARAFSRRINRYRCRNNRHGWYGIRKVS